MHENPPPIPYPGPSPKRVAEKSDELSFKKSFWKPFIVTLIFSLLVTSLVLLLNKNQGKDERFLIFLIVVGFWSIFAAVRREIYKTVISPSGIKGHGIGSHLVTLNWHEVETARPFNLFGLRYLRLYSSQKKRVMWLPLFLQDKRGFKNAVTQFAPPESPLRRYLEDNTHKL